MGQRFSDWKNPEFDERGMTKWNWICQYHENLQMGNNTDIGAFTYINAKFGVEIREDVQIGSHSSLYSWSTIDNKQGKVVVKRGAKIGSHSVIMPGVTVGENAVVGAFSFVTKDIPDGALAVGVPAKVIKHKEQGV
jgi:acetyltransferase-like isoleucine patch superfamily enzyme